MNRFLLVVLSLVVLSGFVAQSDIRVREHADPDKKHILLSVDNDHDYPIFEIQEKMENLGFEVDLTIEESAKSIEVKSGNENGLVWDSQRLSTSRLALEAPVRKFLLDSANEVLISGKIYSVTFNSATSPVSADPRDYYSTHAYWWPNPDTPDGLPYIKIEETNPESRQDLNQLTGLYLDVWKCSIAYDVTGDERFAEHAVGLIRVFFLNPVTGMNPNMDHSKIIPGINETGTFEVATLSNRVRKLWDSINILRKSANWLVCDEVGMKVWTESFLSWMEEDPVARAEYRSLNNHSTAYHLIASVFAKFTGDNEKALVYGRHYQKVMIPIQFEQDGRQTHEMSRSDNLFYHVYNLKTALDILAVVDDLGLDFSSELLAPLDFLLPYISGTTEWPYWQSAPRPHNLKWEHDLLIEASTIFRRPELYEVGNGRYPGAYHDKYSWPPENVTLPH